jgi:uncharacterized membrane protein YidH (DUF202 family)
MPETTEDNRPVQVRNRRVHFANERTFLAWIRTSIGIMAFGFVVEKFAFFLKQAAYYLSASGLRAEGGHPTRPVGPPSPGYSSVLGIMLVALGAIIALLSFARYKKVERQIDEDAYRPSVILDALLTLSVLVIGIFLLIYLLHSI